MSINLNDEKYPDRIIGTYKEGTKAKLVAQQLNLECGFSNEQLKLIHPKDTHFEEKVEPDTNGVGRTLLKSHLILGVLGVVFGLLMASLLIVVGPVFTTSNPMMSLFSMGMIGGFLGLFAAGVISLRPDHDYIIEGTRGATEQHQWSVVVHTKNHSETQKAKSLMQGSALKLSESL